MDNELLEKLSGLLNTHLQKQKFLSFKEAAVYLHLSKSYLYKLTHLRKIGYYKPGGKNIYFDQGELDEWIQQNRIRSESELETQAANYIMLNKGRK